MNLPILLLLVNYIIIESFDLILGWSTDDLFVNVYFNGRLFKKEAYSNSLCWFHFLLDHGLINIVLVMVSLKCIYKIRLSIFIFFILSNSGYSQGHGLQDWEVLIIINNM